MSELLPCPFCGGEAEKLTSSDGFTSIGCLRCNPIFGVMIQRSSEAEAIAAWNTRAERTCRIVKTWSDSDYMDGWRYRCSECGCFIPVNERDPETGDVISAANYCPNCGAKVVSE